MAYEDPRTSPDQFYDFEIMDEDEQAEYLDDLENFELDSAAYKKAAAIANTSKPDLKSFVHVEPHGGSNEAEIQADGEYVRKLQGFFEEKDLQRHMDPEMKKLATALEVMLFDSANRHEWFGEMAQVYPTTDYDDFVGGVDAVVEFREPTGGRGHMGLATDVTYSSHPTKKFQRIVKELKEGKLGDIKYFRSGDGTVEGRLLNLPRVVIMMNQEAARVVVRGWQQEKITKQSLVKVIMLREISLQLERYQKYVEDHELKNAAGTPLSNFYAYPRQKIDALLQEVLQEGYTLEQIDAMEPVVALKGYLDNLEHLSSSDQIKKEHRHSK